MIVESWESRFVRKSNNSTEDRIPITSLNSVIERLVMLLLQWWAVTDGRWSQRSLWLLLWLSRGYWSTTSRGSEQRIGALRVRREVMLLVGLDVVWLRRAKNVLRHLHECMSFRNWIAPSLCSSAEAFFSVVWCLLWPVMKRKDCDMKMASKRRFNTTRQAELGMRLFVPVERKRLLREMP